MIPSLCLEMIFTRLPFVERLAAARRLGYRAVEFWSWTDKPCEEIAARAADLGLTIGAFSGNRRHGLLEPGGPEPLILEVRQSLEAARRMGCRNLMLLACPLNADGSADPLPEETSAEEAGRRAVEALRALAPEAEQADVTLVLEPLNTRLDHPGYFPDRSAVAFDWVREVGSSHIRVLYDVYHMFMMGEDVVRRVEENLDWIGYLHFADAPGRHEPGSGNVPYRELCEMLRRRGYTGLVGLEFSPSGGDEAAARAALRYFIQ